MPDEPVFAVFWLTGPDDVLALVDSTIYLLSYQSDIFFMYQNIN